MCSCHHAYAHALLWCNERVLLHSFWCVHLIHILITISYSQALCLENKFPILDSSSQLLAKTNQPGSPVESECDRRRETNILTAAPSLPQLLNAGFLQSCTSSPKTVLLLHDWWWLNLGSDPYNLHISESPLLSQRLTNGCLVWLQAEQPSGRMLASFWAWKNSQQFNQKQKKQKKTKKQPWVKNP